MPRRRWRVPLQTRRRVASRSTPPGSRGEPLRCWSYIGEPGVTKDGEIGAVCREDNLAALLPASSGGLSLGRCNRRRGGPRAGLHARLTSHASVRASPRSAGSLVALTRSVRGAPAHLPKPGAVEVGTGSTVGSRRPTWRRRPQGVRDGSATPGKAALTWCGLTRAGRICMIVRQ